MPVGRRLAVATLVLCISSTARSLVNVEDFVAVHDGTAVRAPGSDNPPSLHVTYA